MAKDARKHCSPDPLEAAEARVRALAEPLGIKVTRSAAGASRLSLQIEGDEGACVFHVEKARDGAPHFRQGGGLRVWYEREGPSPRWLSGLLGPIADALIETPELAESLASPVDTSEPAQERFPRRTGLDLVRAGIKPATSIFVGAGSDPRTDDLPFVVVSRVSLKRDARGDLVLASPGDVGASRMLYAGRSERDVLRLRDIDEALVKARLTQGLKGSSALQEELGRLLGYPPCCTRAFALAKAPAGSADLHASLCRRERALHTIDPRQNHVLAHFYDFPFLLHIPCREDCEATAELVDRAIEAVYPPHAQRLIREVLSRGALVFPDDRVVFFRATGATDGDSVPVSDFNIDPHPEALPGPREPERCVAKDAAGGFLDSEVTGITLREGRALVRVGEVFVPYEPGGACAGTGPLALVPWGPPGP